MAQEQPRQSRQQHEEDNYIPDPLPDGTPAPGSLQPKHQIWIPYWMKLMMSLKLMPKNSQGLSKKWTVTQPITAG